MVNAFPQDTSPDAVVRQFDVLKKMGTDGRARLTFELSDNLREVALSGIKQRHPEYSKQQLQKAYFKLILDRELFQKAFGDK